MRDEPPTPIDPSHCEDSALRDAIDRFVIGLAERIDMLQDAESAGDLGRLAARVKELAAEANAIGFDGFATAATALEAASLAGDAEDSRTRLVELTEIARRIRLGHRGAM